MIDLNRPTYIPTSGVVVFKPGINDKTNPRRMVVAIRFEYDGSMAYIDVQGRVWHASAALEFHPPTGDEDP